MRIHAHTCRLTHTCTYTHAHVHTCTPTHTCTHTHVHTCTCAHTPTHAHTRTHTHAHVHTCTPTHTCTCAHMYTHAHACTHPHMHIHARARTCTHMHTHPHMRAHTHTHMHTRRYPHTHMRTHAHTHIRKPQPGVRQQASLPGGACQAGTGGCPPIDSWSLEGRGGSREEFRTNEQRAEVCVWGPTVNDLVRKLKVLNFLFSMKVWWESHGYILKHRTPGARTPAAEIVSGRS